MAAARTLQELVAAAASLHPDRPAVKYDSGSGSGIPGSLLLYRDLVQLSGELSLVLRKSCSPNNGAIGLYCGDDLFIPVWILGILQSPAAYVPLDPEAPGLLTARVMDQCGLRYCAVKTDILQRFQASLGEHASVEVCAALPEFRLTLMRIAEHRRRLEQTGTTQTADGAGGTAAGLKEARTRDLAYVLHTSGTTGPPKIVRVPHACILPNILHLRSLFQMSADDVVFLASPLTFDPSVVDMFLALSSGSQLLIIPTVIKKMPRRLAGLLFQDHKTTVLQVTPTLLGRFGRGILKQEVLSSGSSLRVLALGGEACPSPALLRSWRHEDNRTCIWNVYGVTEVSCWASAHRIPDSLLQTSDLMASSVPLGTPLMDTTVEVRDERGGVVTEGEGQVFIGGETRVCLLDDEETVVSGAMRATGDWVDVKDSQLFYLGRRDRLIKRHGKRVNLDSVQQLISSLPQVEVCAVGLHEASRLLAFVVASGPRVQESDPPFTSAEQMAERREDLPSLEGTDADLSRLILNQLSTLLPAHSVPDTLVLVPALSLTHHGKVDMEALFQIYQRRRRRLKSSQGDVTRLKQTLQSLWQETLGLPEDATISEESNFLLSGGDSLKALRLSEDILVVTGSTTSPELLEAILDGTFSDVLRHVALTAPSEVVQSSSVRKHQHTDDSASAVPAKIERTTEPESPPGESRAVRVIRRAGEVMQISPEERPDLRADDSSGKPGGGGVLGLRLSWSSDTGRCVDASPVLLVHRADPGSGEVKATVFIGSHSHRMQALDLTGGGLLWERVLGGRIEASAAVSRCGSLVVVGCYDGGVYFLCTASGETRWVFETGDAVKCCPAVDPLRGLVMVGSHDGHVYALDPEVRRCVWRRSCGGGAVFSSPYLHASLRRLYAASLGGHLTCLNADSGDVLWSHRRDAAFFSSPNAAAGHVAIGSVDGNICCFRDAGTPVWQFLTEGPVFSSPCVTPDRRSVLCGSHDGRLYCVNVADGSLSWTFQTVGKVYSSPCVIDGSVVGRIGTLVALASTEGTVWILDGQTGKKLASFGLPGELFSSPVVFGRSLVVGCRNDYVYCLELTVEEDVRFLE